MPVRLGPVATVVAALALAVALVVGRADAAPASPGGDRSLGQELWRESCAVCHGPTGGGTARGPDLDGVGAAGVWFQVSTGRMPLMAPSERAHRGPVTFAPAEIDALVAYAATVVPGPPVPEVDLAGSDLSAGGQAFRQRCASCHEMTGQGGILTDGRNVPPLDRADPQEVVAAIRSGPNDMPIFPESLVDDATALDIAAYVQELRDPQDRGGWSLGHWGPVTEGAAAFAFGLIPLLLATRWLGERNPPPQDEDEIR